MKIYVGSCPDYSHSNGKYDHHALGDSIPLLTSLHLETATQIFPKLDRLGVDYEYIMMVADVEATDPYFAQRFAGGDENIFLQQCNRSIAETSDLMQQLKSELRIGGVVRSSSFFSEFGRETYVDTMVAYQRVLSEAFQHNSTFRSRVMTDTSHRMGMYHKMYPTAFKTDGYGGDTDFLYSRTMRTMAQYLALGKLIAQDNSSAVIINHPTVNIPFYNERNRFLLPQNDLTRTQPTIPVLKMTQAVY